MPNLITLPKRRLVTAGMPYANGFIHLGHLAGAHTPADAHARWSRLLLGSQNVRFICGSDDYGSPSVKSAREKGMPVHEFVADIRAKQAVTLERYGISLDRYAGSSHPDFSPVHTETTQHVYRRLHERGFLVPVETRQWFDPQANMFLSDRLVQGECPCCHKTEAAFSDMCDSCENTYEPHQLINPRSAMTGATPEMRLTMNWSFQMSRLRPVLRQWLETKSESWRALVLGETLALVIPTLRIHPEDAAKFKAAGLADLPAHRAEKGALYFNSDADVEIARLALEGIGVRSQAGKQLPDREITRDIEWGVPLPVDIDARMAGKSAYVWTESLVAPISFNRVVGRMLGLGDEDAANWWYSSQCHIDQFIGQDNTSFYVLMEGALMVALAREAGHLPQDGDLQLPMNVVANHHLMVQGSKMSKSRGNFYLGDDPRLAGFTVDQLRYFLLNMALAKNNADFDPAKVEAITGTLTKRVNSAMHRMWDLASSHFGGSIPMATLPANVTEALHTFLDGKEKPMPAGLPEHLRATFVAKRVPGFAQLMEKFDYPAANLLVIDLIKLFEEQLQKADRDTGDKRAEALYAAAQIAKVLMLALSPFVPEGTDRMRQVLNLGPDIWSWEEVRKPVPGGHHLGSFQVCFPRIEQPAAA